jgi:hypothetical protein
MTRDAGEQWATGKALRIPDRAVPADHGSVTGLGARLQALYRLPPKETAAAGEPHQSGRASGRKRSCSLRTAPPLVVASGPSAGVLAHRTPARKNPREQRRETTT